MPPTIQDAMLHRAKTLPGTATLGEVRTMLASDHVHLVVLVDDRRLIGTIRRSDLPVGVAAIESALPFATVTGRFIHPEDDLETLRSAPLAQCGRRLAVVDQSGALACLKLRGDGSCSDSDTLEHCQDRSPEPTPGNHVSGQDEPPR